MELAFPWPASPGEWLAISSALLTALVGLVAVIAPGAVRHLLPPRGLREFDAALGAGGAFGGFLVGAGLSAAMLAQPLIYLALGLSWAGAVAGHVVSILTGRTRALRSLAALAIQLVAAALPLAFVFGVIR